MDVPGITLNSGTVMPQLGFGVWQVGDDEATTAVAEALRAGYRLIDTAAGYSNEPGVGRALADSGIARGELFITTKLANPDQGRDAALRAFDTSLAKLGLDHVDLYLIHWPIPHRDRYVETWRALEEIHADGRAKAIGVSNFQIGHLERLAKETGTVPAVNQIELHPQLSQAQLREYHADHGIATEAWSPLGQGGDLLTDPALTAIAEAHGVTVAQVVLRWHLQLGNIAIPKSVTPSRIAANIDVFGFALTDTDLATITALDSGRRLGPDPDTFGK
ncbi:aldo/keto reductase [Phytomonospora endophytica]|uniref:Diketogulonate reductase-like aldo/keto reductase n=2 Tax=Phytomonospora endophytica TaxID=714109 RepID=A0A841FFM5_9ACTN|nr:aldo/keto reductase [Phytomonospora endophytica]MBB6033803.1 diketogulonate reductase-like aldo/keto reductase [Phytomonospora endophytica]GIG64679.1 oxidoreductase [Phytomonospora endophytica]